mgnify:CR=1 FL=1
MNRYARQMQLPQIGADGQARVQRGHALVIGCGALGCAAADLLARAGVGRLTLVDRDVVEPTNLQRQCLFTEADAAAGRLKADAAAARLGAVNSEIEIRAVADDVHAGSLPDLLDDVDVIVDGVDNFETRYLLNDVAVADGFPYVYGGAIATHGMRMTILGRPEAARHHRSAITWTPEQATACLRCLFPEPPPPGATPTCETAGVLGPVIQTIAALQVTEVLKLLAGRLDDLRRNLLRVDVWDGTFRTITADQPRTGCPCCGQSRFDALDHPRSAVATAMCGSATVQIHPPVTEPVIELPRLAKRLADHGSFRQADQVLRGRLDHEPGDDGRPVELLIFSNGRALVRGLADPGRARALYARYVGT